MNNEQDGMKNLIDEVFEEMRQKNKEEELEDQITFHGNELIDLDVDDDLDDNWEEILDIIEENHKGLGKNCRKAEMIGINKEENCVAFVFVKINEEMFSYIHDVNATGIILDAVGKFTEKDYGVQFIELLGGDE